MSDNISGHGSKSKNVARRLFPSFPLLLDEKSRLLISEMVSSESVQKVWALLKKVTFRPTIRNISVVLIGLTSLAGLLQTNSVDICRAQFRGSIIRLVAMVLGYYP